MAKLDNENRLQIDENFIEKANLDKSKKIYLHHSGDEFFLTNQDKLQFNSYNLGEIELDDSNKILLNDRVKLLGRFTNDCRILIYSTNEFVVFTRIFFIPENR